MKSARFIFFFCILSLIFSSEIVHAFTEGSDNIPTPAQHTGIDVGADRVLADWNQIESYFRIISKKSSRVELREIGKSEGGKTILVALISAPGHLRNLEDLIEKQQELTFNPMLSPDDSLFRDHPAFVLINNSMHSSEVGPAQFSMELLYWLASGSSKEVANILNNCVICLVPTPNPDGLDMVVSWYRQWLGTEYEGRRQPWLYQKYAGHDNNRDWYMLNLRETQHMTTWLNTFLPVVVWDAHQMGSSGYRVVLPPFIDPPNKLIHAKALTSIEAAGLAMKNQVVRDGLNGVAHSYAFSVWWNGGFRTVPYFKNSIGLLSETAGADLATPIEISKSRLENGSRDYTQKTIVNPAPWNGGRWGLPEILKYHKSMATGLLTWCANNAQVINSDYRQMNLAALSADDNGPAGYLIPENQFDRTALARLMEILDSHRIQIFRLSATVIIDGITFETGSYVVPGQQAFRPMLRSLLERQQYPDVRDYDGRKVDPYDITAWNLNDLMSIDVFPIDQLSWDQENIEKYLADVTMPEQTIVKTSTGNTIAPARDLESYRFVWKMLNASGSIWSEMSGEVDGLKDQFISYDASHDASAMDISTIEQQAKEQSMTLPRLALLVGNYGNIDAGWTSWLFDNLGIPWTDLTSDRIKQGDLEKDFDVIVLPSISESYLLRGRGDDYPPDYRAGIGTAGLQQLETFVLHGGRLITLDSSSRTAIKYFGLPVIDLLRTTTDEQFLIPGSIVGIDINRDSALSFGMPKETASLFRWSLAFDIPDEAHDQVTVAASYQKGQFVLSGFSRGEERITGRAAVVTVTHGDGDVVLFGFPPQFRGQTWSTFKLLLNAILFSTNEAEKLPVLKDGMLNE